MSVNDKKIVLPGGSGYIGHHLSRYFAEKGWSVVVLSRSEGELSDHVRYVWWDGVNLDAWADEIDGANVVVNLAGRSVNCRYGKKNRKQIYDSRDFSTQVVGKAIAKANQPPSLWLNASSATIYRHSLDSPMDETTGEIDFVEPGNPKDKWEFSVDVVNRWEQALFNADTPGTRRIAMRLSMVFGTGKGGVYEAFRNIARLGLSGTQGSGNQFVSWLHMEDFLRMIDWCIGNESIKGPINMCAPKPLPNREFLKALRIACGAKLGLPSKSWMLEIGAFFMRTETELLLKSRKVIPGKLLESGFKFTYPDWPEAVQAIEAVWSNDKK
ncbi:MAG: TIGR01777 family oxidoreductase [Verrucomicrobiota bacterium]|nr:TIGR01777 family oxidoreductase [Verrucomicrobiota bacterium]